MHIVALFRKFERNRTFSESEAWTLFSVAAIAEACGWTLLIVGIGCTRFLVHGNQAPVVIAGRLHGTVFLLYATASVGLYPNLGWSRTKSFVALLASVPPYGSLIFEQWASYRRRHAQFKKYACCLLLVYADRLSD